MREFNSWGLMPFIGGEFWPWPSFGYSKRKNITSWVFGWLYFGVAIVKLHKRP